MHRAHGPLVCCYPVVTLLDRLFFSDQALIRSVLFFLALGFGHQWHNIRCVWLQIANCIHVCIFFIFYFESIFVRLRAE
ncbi:hypothetical protein EDB89DRAFT_2008016 [Lactarius sanguifluus]|nr:hypothetical protein EDB89DRAFT_2008016 [Lactarius sanguifluus]